VTRRFVPPLALASLLALGLGACSTTREVEGTVAITGKELDAAVALYGNWDEKLLVKDRPVYIWRRQNTGAGGRVYFCEMRVEMGWHSLIGRALTHGYPSACALFNVKYESHVK
jgi:hypothetical protein